MILAIDTETTGLPRWKKPSDDPDQPYIVQYAAALVDPATRSIEASWNYIVRPDGWTISAEATAIHGITTEEANLKGVSESIVVRTYVNAWLLADTLLGYAPLFDRRIMRIAMLRDGMTKDQIEALERKPTIDVMQAATKVCKLPPTDAMMAAGNRSFKPPSLLQAARLIIGERIIGAHDAETDVGLTLMLHWRLQDLQKGPSYEPTNDGAAHQG